MDKFESAQNNRIDFKKLVTVSKEVSYPFEFKKEDGFDIRTELLAVQVCEYLSLISKSQKIKDKQFLSDYIEDYSVNVIKNLIISYKLKVEEIRKVSFKMGVLSVDFYDGSKKSFNILPENSSKSQKENEKAFLKKNSKLALENLRNDSNIESYPDLGMAVSYALAPGTGLYYVSKIVFKKADGKKGVIKIKDSPKLSKIEHSKNLLKLLKKNGLEYDAAHGTVESASKTILRKTIEIAKRIRYEDIKKTHPEVTRQEFEAGKDGFIKKARKGIKNFGEKYQGAISSIESKIFMPIFFREYYKNSQDLSSIGKSFAEMGLFHLGAKVGAAAAPGFLKMPVSLISGALFTVAGEAYGGAIQLDKQFWRVFPEREDFFEKTGSDRGKSFFTHAITMGAAHDVLDKVGGKGDVDIGIPGTKGGFYVKNGDFTIPEIDFIKSSIDLSTDPRAYMSNAKARGKEFWNNKVDNYGKWLKSEVLKLLDAYNLGKFPFGKNKKANYALFEKRLDSILKGSGDFNGFEDIIESIRNTIIDKDKKTIHIGDKNRIMLIIDNQLSLVKIDDFFISEGKKNNIKEGRNISDIIHGPSKETLKMIRLENLELAKIRKIYPESAGLIKDIKVEDMFRKFENIMDLIKSDPKKQKLLDNMIERLLKHKDILQTREDKRLYSEMLNSKHMKPKTYRVMLDELNVTGFKVKKGPISTISCHPAIKIQQSAGDEFVILLNMIVEYKRQREFLDNLSKTGYGTEWRK
ncbi:MAG: hypothetical protein PHS92_03155 [Candidatus Gracilibacteria bacterium]|nr:hypothetical protein [Candidatus Gracilibacteria bacterium]